MLSLFSLTSGFHAAAPIAGISSRAPAPAMMPSQAVVDAKSKIVSEVVEHMEGSQMLFAVRSEGIKPNDMNMMRQKFPEEVTIRCVKNTLMRRAADEVPKCQGGEFPWTLADGTSLLERSNYWFFVPEGKVRETVDIWDDWVKETKNEDTAILGGVFEGDLLDYDGVQRVKKLPTKQELMGTTAVLLKAIPTKLAKSLKAAGPERLARVTKQAAGQKLVQAVKAVEGKL